MPKRSTTPAAAIVQSDRPLDQYYTQPQTALDCVEHLREVLPDISADLYLEPSAGDGAFLDLLPRPRIGLDIAPAGSEIRTEDFLSWTPEENAGRIITVGNPPFGKNASLAVAFFNHAAVFSEIIAMILSGSFTRVAMQNRLDRRFHLMSERPLVDEPFRFGDRLHRVDTVFQIWQRMPTERANLTPCRTHADFSFVKDIAEADFAMRRVGAHAGKVLQLPDNLASATGYSPASNYFIKSTGIPAEVLEARFRSLDLSESLGFTPSYPSISKEAIIASYEARIAFETVLATARQSEGSRVPETSI